MVAPLANRQRLRLIRLLGTSKGHFEAETQMPSLTMEILPPDELQRILDPAAMTRPGVPTL